jgi:hypothetical protein
MMRQFPFSVRRPGILSSRICVFFPSSYRRILEYYPETSCYNLLKSLLRVNHASTKKNTRFPILLLSSTELVIRKHSHSSVRCSFTRHVWRAIFFTKFRQKFSMTHTLQKYWKWTLFSRKHLSHALTTSTVWDTTFDWMTVSRCRADKITQI